MGGWLPRFVDIFLWRFFGSSIHVSSLLMDGFPEEANRATRIEEIAIVEFPAQIDGFLIINCFTGSAKLEICFGL